MTVTAPHGARLAQGGWGPPPPGGFSPAGPPGGFSPGAPPGGKPITGSPQTMAMYAATLDPRTGLPVGEKPPAGTASIVAIVCGVLLCLGPITGVTAIIAGIIGMKKAKSDPVNVGGFGLSVTGLVLGLLNLLGSMLYLLIVVASML